MEGSCVPCGGQPTGEFLPHVFDDAFTRQISGDAYRQLSGSRSDGCTPVGSNGKLREALVAQAGLPLEEPEAGAPVLGVPGGTEWWQSLLVILASLIGVGVLSLPQAMADLGWLPGAAALFASSAMSCWSGRLYGQLVVAVPKAQVLADVTEAAYGRAGRVATMWLGYTYIAGVGVVYHLTASQALQQVFVGVPYVECQPVTGLLFGILTLVPLQAQSMHAVSILSAAGSLTVAAALAIVCAKLLAAGPAADAQTAAVEPFEPRQWAAAVTCCTYAFAGQAIFVELASKQRDFGSFRRAVDVSSGTAVVVYSAAAALGYAYIGSRIRGPLTSALAVDAWTRLVNVLLFLHVAISYVIELNVLTDAVLRLLPRCGRASAAAEEPFGRLAWFAGSSTLVAFAYVLETSVPFFSELVSLSGALGATQLMLTLPALCALRLLPGMGACQRWACYAAVPAAACLTLLGTSGALANMARALRAEAGPQPWSCAAPGAAAGAP